MTVFEKISPDNTEKALTLAVRRAAELDTDMVLATSTGASAYAALDMSVKMNFTGRVVAVTSVWGSKNQNENYMTRDEFDKLAKAGAILVTAGHALSGVERSLSRKFNGTYPVEIISHTLRMICEGMKVCVEICAMAMDAGMVEPKRPVVALGGTGRGLDTACVVTPGYSAGIFDTRVHEILCKPR